MARDGIEPPTRGFSIPCSPMRLYPITIRARREVTERFSQLWESVHYADNVRDVEDPNDRASLVRIIGATTIDVMRREGKWLIYLTVSPRIHHNWEIVFRLCCFDHQWPEQHSWAGINAVVSDWGRLRNINGLHPARRRLNICPTPAMLFPARRRSILGKLYAGKECRSAPGAARACRAQCVGRNPSDHAVPQRSQSSRLAVSAFSIVFRGKGSAS